MPDADNVKPNKESQAVRRPEKGVAETGVAETGLGKVTGAETGMLRQGWMGVAFWMAVGLLLEGLLGYKTPSYLNDPQRRELFRLAHAHGTLLSAVLILAALTAQRHGIGPRAVQTALRVGAVMMPVGFLLAGVWHPEGDPGLAIWLVPPGALLVIFGAVAITLSIRSGKGQAGTDR